MKKLKLLPSVLMLVLCVGVLCMGIYAATPNSNKLSGQIIINQIGASVDIQVWTENHDGSEKSAVQSFTDVATGGKEFTFNTGLEIDQSSASTKADFKPVYVKAKIINKSTEHKLGVFFSKTAMTDFATESDIFLMEDLQSNSKVSAVSKDYYKYIGEKDGADSNEGVVTLEFSANDWLDESGSAGFTYFLNIERYQSDLELEGTSIMLSLPENVSAVGTLSNEFDGVRLTTNNVSNVWNPTFEFSNTVGTNAAFYSYYEKYLLPTEVLTLKLTNNSGKPVSASVKSIVEENRDDIIVSSTGASYIPNGETGEVTIQFSPKAGITTPPSSAEGYVFKVEVEECDEVNIKSRVKEVENSANYLGGRFKYYVEFGEYNGTPLKWFIYAYDNAGTITSITATGAPNPKTSETAYNYYFVSEKVIDNIGAHIHAGDMNMYVFDGEYISYSNSTIKHYINGVTYRDGRNFYNKFKLNEDAIFGEIINITKDNCQNKFTLFSLRDLGFTTEQDSNYVEAPVAGDGTFGFFANKTERQAVNIETGSVSSYWLDSEAPNSSLNLWYIYGENGTISDEASYYSSNSTKGIRPIFKLEI